MYKISKNPVILDLTKTHKGRRFNLSNLEGIQIDGQKYCIWCVEVKLTGRKYKWCSKECSLQALAWANPQKEAGLHILLVRQDFKCNLCSFDYTPYIEDTLKYLNKNASSKSFLTCDPDTIRNKIHERLMKILKYEAPTDHRPEVDHIVPVSKQGQSIGLENHQILCAKCHKAKSKIDNTGPRKKR